MKSTRGLLFGINVVLGAVNAMLAAYNFSQGAWWLHGVAAFNGFAALFCWFVAVRLYLR